VHTMMITAIPLSISWLLTYGEVSYSLSAKDVKHDTVSHQRMLQLMALGFCLIGAVGGPHNLCQVRIQLSGIDGYRGNSSLMTHTVS
jgi:hypothetical protein